MHNATLIHKYNANECACRLHLVKKENAYHQTSFRIASSLVDRRSLAFCTLLHDREKRQKSQTTSTTETQINIHSQIFTRLDFSAFSVYHSSDSRIGENIEIRILHLYCIQSWFVFVFQFILKNYPVLNQLSGQRLLIFSGKNEIPFVPNHFLVIAVQ